MQTNDSSEMFLIKCWWFLQWVLSGCVPAAATPPLVQGGRGWTDRDPSGRVAPEAPAVPGLHQTHGWTVPPQKKDHGQPIQT